MREAETPGIVLIDELDFHPSWQRRVIEDLRRTFPKLQFICTTHSPFIIQSARPGDVISLDGSIEVEDYVGASIEDIAEHVQGTEEPQQSRRAIELARASEGYTSEPGLNALLKLEALAAEEAAKRRQ